MVLRTNIFLSFSGGTWVGPRALHILGKCSAPASFCTPYINSIIIIKARLFLLFPTHIHRFSSPVALAFPSLGTDSPASHPGKPLVSTVRGQHSPLSTVTTNEGNRSWWKESDFRGRASYFYCDSLGPRVGIRRKVPPMYREKKGEQ